jgi:hypothetical protein
MRSLFHQYKEPENQVTHALAVCLAEDPNLLREFVERWIGQRPPGRKRLEVVEQHLPGDEQAELAEDVAGKGGLPDICIHDGESWCLAIESKVGGNLAERQLRRHEQSLKRRFPQVHVMAIIAREQKPAVFKEWLVKRWPGLYQWCRVTAVDSDWARRFADYLEEMEAEMVEEGSLREGALTTFLGVPFGPHRPYNYLEAKRILGVALGELRQRQDLETLGVGPGCPGRGKITGGEGVWDALRLGWKTCESKIACCPGIADPKHCLEKIQSFPHLNLGIGRTDVSAKLILPDKMVPKLTQSLCGLGYRQFLDLLQEVERGMSERLNATLGVDGWGPYLEVYQRHWHPPNPGGNAITDAAVTVDLRMIFSGEHDGNPGGVKSQPGWERAIEGAFEALAHKRGANIELALGAKFPYRPCPAMATPEALNHIAAVWMSCAPLINALFAG